MEVSGESIAGIVVGIVVFLFALVIFALFIWSLIWAYRDAEKRGKSGCLVALLILLLNWPISLLLWAVFRPEKKIPAFQEHQEKI